MHFIYRYPFLIALLLRFSLGFPSSGDKNEPSERFEGLHIGEINIYIHCYFNKDDPICKDERNDVPETEEGEASNSSGNDKTDSDESYEEELDVDGGGVSSSSTNDDLDNNEDYEEAPDDVNINDKLPSLTSIKSSVNELFGSYEPAADSNKFEDMENYSEYWPSRIRARDELCVMCLAIMTNQEILESEHAMNKVRTNRGSNWKMLRAIVEKLVSFFIFIFPIQVSPALNYHHYLLSFGLFFLKSSLHVQPYTLENKLM